MAVLNIVQAVTAALMSEMERDRNVVVLGEDVAADGGVFRATDGLWKKFPDRVFDTPLAESAIIGTSIGLAMYGLKPVAEIQFEGFSYSTLDQVIAQAGKVRARSRGRFTCPMVMRFPYGGGIHAPEQHSESPETYYVHTPGIKVVVPSTPYDTKGLLISAIRDPDPVVFMEPKRIYRAIKQEVPDEVYTVTIGEAKTVRSGDDATIFAWGAMVPVCLQAADMALSLGASCEVIDLRTLSPMDTDAIIGSVKKTGRAVIVHEAPRSCGVGAEIAALISDRDLLYLEAPVARVTGYDTAMPLYRLENHYLPNAQKVLEGVEKVMGF